MVDKNLVFKDKVVLTEGKWNGLNYPCPEIEKMVDSVKRMPPEERSRALSIFTDHNDNIRNYIGQAENLRYDVNKKAAIADLIFMDDDVIKKLKFQNEEQGKLIWGISPSLNVTAREGKAVDIILKSLSLVVNQAQGVHSAL